MFQTLAKAFLLNNEPKSAQVCLNEGAKVWAEASAEMSAAERSDCERRTKVLEAKVQMERQNTTVIGDLNSYAFLKSTAEQKAAAQPKA